MGGTTKGGQAAAATMKRRYGADYYEVIGRKGKDGWEKNGKKPRGMAYLAIHDPVRFKKLSARGGKKSRRPKESK